MGVPVDVRPDDAAYWLRASDGSDFLLWSQARPAHSVRRVASVWTPHADLMRFFGGIDAFLRGAEEKRLSWVFNLPYTASAVHDDGTFRETPLWTADGHPYSCRSLCKSLHIHLDRLVRFSIQDKWGSLSLSSMDGASPYRVSPGMVSVLSIERPDALPAFVEASTGLELLSLDYHFRAIY